MFRFATPWALTLLPLALAAWWRLDRRLRRGDARAALPEAAHLGRIGASFWTRLERALPVARALAVALGVVALARPQWGHAVENVSSQGVDIVVALDVSGSMRCEDERPRSRLEVARASLKRFVEGRPGDRIGLVAFASLAATRCPLTLDHDMLIDFVEGLDYAPAGEDRTAIGMGLATAVKRLEGSKAKSRVAVVLTDGRNNEGQIGPETAAEAARALGMRVYTIGVGSEEEAYCPVDTPSGPRYVAQREELDEPLLKRLAEPSGGRYFRAADPRGLEDAFREIDALEKTTIESRIRVLYSEKFPWALVPAGVLFLAELALGATRLRRLP
jgi:Ca-activated chloride channel family protein